MTDADAGRPIRRRTFLLGGAAAVGAAVVLPGSMHTLPSFPNPPRPDYVLPDVVANGIHDDRAAIQTAIDGLPARGGTIWLPGLCYVGSAGMSSGAPYGIAVTQNNVTLTGPSGAGLRSTVPGIRLIVASGVGLLDRGDPLDETRWATGLPVLPFSGPQREGASAVTLARSRDARTLAAGDLVFLRTGNLVDSALPREPDSELNEVVSVSGRQVNLRHATKKSYVPERFFEGEKGLTSPEGSGAPAPFGLVKVTDRVLRNTTVRNLRLLAPDITLDTTSGLHVNHVWGLTVERCEVRFGKWGIEGRYARDVRIKETTLYTFGSATGDPAWIGPSTGCSDWRITSCRGYGAVPAKLHCHEGVSDLDYTDWVSRVPDGPGKRGSANVSIRQRAYRQRFDLDMAGAYTSADCNMVLVTSSVSSQPGNVTFTKLRLRGRPGRAHVEILSQGVSISAGSFSAGPRRPTIRVLSGVNPFVHATGPAPLPPGTTTDPAVGGTDDDRVR